jgi:Transcriptional regulators, similar to M. xanthus CarD
MFGQNETVVYPAHGVARIHRILDRRVDGKVTQFYELKFIKKEMTILVPVNNIDAVGIRPLSSQEDITNIGKIFACRYSDNHNAISSWNKRNKDYLCKIRSGKFQDVCEIYRDLKQISQIKELSFGEKTLLQQTEALLVEEIALVYDTGYDGAIMQLNMWVQVTAQQAQ